MPSTGETQAKLQQFIPGVAAFHALDDAIDARRVFQGRKQCPAGEIFRRSAHQCLA
jgi:hypothetical protein